jgi:hypothetical protein
LPQFQTYPNAKARDGSELIVILQDGETRKELLVDVIPPPVSVLDTLLAGLDTAASAVAVAASDTVLSALGKLQAQFTTLSSPFLTVLNTALDGLSTATSAAVTATDTVLGAVGKLQAQITGEVSRAAVAEALLAPKASPTFTGLATFGPTTQTTSGTLTQGTYSLQSATGTATFATYQATFPHAGFAHNCKYVWNDGVVLAQDQFANNRQIVLGDVIDHTISDAGVNGARIAHGAFLRVLAPVNTVGNFMGASWHYAQSVAPVIGSSVGTPRGSLYGMNPQANLAAGATNYVSVMAGEADVSVSVGASVQYKWGWCISTVEGDAVRGSVAESALHIGAVPSTGGWFTGITFSDFNGGGMPIAAGGTLLKGQKFAAGTIPIAHGVDLTAFAIAGAAFKSPGFLLDGVGNLQAASATYLGAAIGANGLTVSGPLAVNGSTVAIQGPVGITDVTAASLSQFTIDGHLNSTIGARVTLTGNGATTPSKHIRVFGGTLQVLNNAATTALLSVTDTGVQVSPAGGSLGFYGTSPQSKPAITGAKGGNAALASLLTQLAALGLITDSTSA